MSFQNAFNKIVGGAVVGKMLQQRMEKAQKSVQEIKDAKLKQRAMRTKYQAQIAKNRLAKKQSSIKLKELKNDNITIGGVKVTDPNLIKKIKEASK